MGYKNAPISKWLGPIVGVIVGAGLGYSAAKKSGDINPPLMPYIVGGAILGGVAGIIMLLMDLKRQR